ncbi:MAG: MFS transporter [Clostridia bacterium]|nr:MFS transporter [Clostridia bacterium]
MYSLLLAVIYLAFISLGLPDSLLGSGWPVMQGVLEVPVSYAGIISMIICGGTIVSSLSSNFLTQKLNTGLVTAFSAALSALSLFGFSVADSFWELCFWAVPYGLSAGAIDAAMNNYVAIHYSSKTMSWLHASWGVGVTISPYIMGFCLSHQYGWNMGYRSVFFIQLLLACMTFLALPLWDKRNKATEGEKTPKQVTLKSVLKISGVPYILLAFFGFCALESTAGLWASSYMVGARSVDPETAARFAALFYLGETAGRFLNGFVADRYGDKTMIQVGIWTMLVGVVMILLPISDNTVALAGLIVVGLGAAPVYPCIIHATPLNFGEENSQALVGIQMASAYVGSTFMPPLFGILAQYLHIGWYPVYLGALVLLMLMSTGCLNRCLEQNGEE